MGVATPVLLVTVPVVLPGTGVPGAAVGVGVAGVVGTGGNSCTSGLGGGGVGDLGLFAPLGPMGAGPGADKSAMLLGTGWGNLGPTMGPWKGPLEGASRGLIS